MGVLVAESVSKRFGELQALDDVSATFLPGEIHAVLGENGAGKSTFMGVLSGFVPPDSGSVSLGGEPLPLGRPFDCKRQGIEMIHQHFTLVPEFTVSENLALAALPGLYGRSSVASRAEAGLKAAQELGWELDPDARVRDLSVGAQQRIEILKAVAADADVMIFDEPTAVLSEPEVADLMRVLRALREQGRTVVLIAHKLSEILGIADRVTVLRLGRVVGNAPRDEVDEDRLVAWMVGELPLKSDPPDFSLIQPGIRAVSLSLLGDRGEEAVREASFEIGRGEILGFGGVDGNGQVELAEALAGVRGLRSGVLEWIDKPFDPAAVKTAYVPQDRHQDGLALNLSIQDNVTIAALDKRELTMGPILKRREIRAWTDGLIERFEVRAQSPKQPVRALSGGNQQKIVVGRALSEAPELLVVVNPTRGLDVRATAYVRERILWAKAEGAAVALFSTDLDELVQLSDRTLFMTRGRLVEGNHAGAVVGS